MINISSNNEWNFVGSLKLKRKFLNNLFMISKQCLCCMKILFQMIKFISTKKRFWLLFFLWRKLNVCYVQWKFQIAKAICDFSTEKNHYFDKCEAQNSFFLCMIMMTKSFIEKDFFHFFRFLQIKMSDRWIHIDGRGDFNKCLYLIEVQFCLHVRCDHNIIHKLWFFFD